MNKDQITQLIQEMIQKHFDGNYLSGIPKIPPHTHNGIDNLKISAANIVGLTSSQAFPVGAVYINVTNVNPATELGYGTWTALGSGQVLVGYASGDPDFGTILATGGAKTVTLTNSQIPPHAHTFQRTTIGFTTQSNGGANTGTTGAGSSTVAGVTLFANTDLDGGGASHTNLQPFVVVAFWQRTA